jgi:ferredoxin-NADP reductase
MLDRTLTVRVSRKKRMTGDVTAFEFVHPWGRTLPGYQPGAHIDVHLPGGFTRQYSLAVAEQGSPAAGPGCTRYVIGVKREAGGRGGSAALHDRVHEGDLITISQPRNGFGLHAQARHHLLLAGGIGLTPLLAMAQQLKRQAAAFTLCVFARSRGHLAFADALTALGANVRLHFDTPATGPQVQQLDIAELLRHHDPSTHATHLYLCGPAGFMKTVLDVASRHSWPEDHVHLEFFAPPQSAAGGGDSEPSEPFTLVARVGGGRQIEVQVGADQTAVDALHDLGIDVPTSCAQGVCGTCVVDLAAGEPEHHDHCLTATERQHKVALCCARAKAGSRLVVELSSG